ncbi:D-glycerate dehydrogenase [Parvibaculaceae bacterium PLY_AMNH_Bact1]|nr:D-glycerate dehydrogenase [Parvibaculaceae bacterium PLY_AMNH_Bact1]
MSKPRILVTRKLPPAVEERLQKDYQPSLNDTDEIYGQEELIERAKDTDGLLVTVTDSINRDVIARLPEKTKMIATFSVGYDQIDVAAAQERGITVSNTPGVLTNATADIAMLLLLGAARGAGNGEQAVRQNTWKNWAPTGFLGRDLTGKRLGILGMGRIGQAVAKRARAFDMEIHYHNRNPLSEHEEAGACYHSSLQSLLPNCDFLSIHAASTPQTRGIINENTLHALPPGAIIVNTARGDLVDDDALISALTSGHVGAAGLDVFNNEPDLDQRYRTLPNTFLLPHLGSATLETRNAMGFCALDNLDAFFAGKPLPNPVAL